jgi:hypothetical protein
MLADKIKTNAVPIPVELLAGLKDTSADKRRASVFKLVDLPTTTGWEDILVDALEREPDHTNRVVMGCRLGAFGTGRTIDLLMERFRRVESLTAMLSSQSGRGN